MDAGDLVASLQPFTKIYMITSIITSIIVTLKIIPPVTLAAFSVPSDFWKLWKLPASLTYRGPFSLNYIFNLIFFYMTINPLERNYVPTFYGEFLMLLSFVFCSCFFLGSLINWGGYFVISKSFSFALTYIYCKKFPNDSIILFFVLKVKTAYYPFATMAVSILMGDNWKHFVIGLIVGHFYIFLKEVLPISHRKNFLKTPFFMTKLGQIVIQKYVFGNPVHAQNLNRFQADNEEAAFRPAGGR